MIEQQAGLVVGADGIIGRALVEDLTYRGIDIYETTHHRERVSQKRDYLDLTKIFTDWNPPCAEVAYLCAAVSSLERCRKNPSYSSAVNVTGTTELITRLIEHGIFVVFLSSNTVYDGNFPFRDFRDRVCPQTEYGRQKAETEQRLQQLEEEDIAIVRLTKVVHAHIPLFRNWIDALKSGNVIHPFSDMVMAPILLSFVTKALYHVAHNHLSGIIQISGTQDITYEQAALHIARRLNAKPHLVQAICSDESTIHFEAQPKHTTLDTTRLQTELHMTAPDVWETLDAIVEQ